MKYIIIAFFVLLSLKGNSQTSQNPIGNKNLHSSINTAGGNISGEEGSVSYSIGQINYLSYNGNSNAITEGVQQPIIISLRVNDKNVEVEETFTMAAYPNPVTNYFVIEASSYSNRSLKYHLSDLNGNLIEEGVVSSPGTKVDISRLAVAIYLLNITDNTKLIKTFRIIKK